MASGFEPEDPGFASRCLQKPSSACAVPVHARLTRGSESPPVGW